MFILYNGKRTRVELIKDPTWSKTDIWSFGNMYVKLIHLGYSPSEANSYGVAYVLKNKWPETVYSISVEKVLSEISS